jgi:hypothetical protein
MIANRLFTLTVAVIFISISVKAQVVTVSGKISEEGINGALSGATVRVVETGTKTATDVEGRFFLKLEKGENIAWKCISLGFSTKIVSEVIVYEGANVDITLQRQKQKK